MSLQVFGVPVSRGVAIGRAVLVASSRVDVDHYFIDPADISAEVRRLRDARDSVAAELEHLQTQLPQDAPGELSALLDVHLMLLHDELLTEATKLWVRDRHYNAEWALSAQMEVLARQFDEMEDEYLRERKADVEQVVERLLKALARPGTPTTPRREMSGPAHGGDPLVLVASDIAPADMLHFKGGVFSGFVTDVGGRTSHTAIVARSLDIPAIVGTREASRLIRQDDWVVIDGEAGVVVVNPSEIILEEYRYRQRKSELERVRLDRLRHTPAVTLDGEPVRLLANIELPADAVAAVRAGAVGVGLFRSEFLFMNRNGSLPDEQEQYESYCQAVRALQGLPLIIRTVDVGADKPLDAMSLQELRHERTLNPALGLRAIRWSLSEPDMFRQQLRAILRVAALGSVSVLVPMVAHVREVAQTREVLDHAVRELQERGQPFGQVKLGAMIEVPAAALMIEALLPHLDFVSLGTNDLVQYTLAIDRADESVAHLYDPWHPAVLQLIHRTISSARSHGVEVSVCGEMAGDTAFTEVLLAMGLRNFSMHPAQIAAVKQRVLRSDAARLAGGLLPVLHAEQPLMEAQRIWGALAEGAT